MKNFLFILAVFCLFGSTLNAQSAKIPVLTIAPTGASMTIPPEYKSTQVVPDSETLIISKFSTVLRGYVTVGFDRSAKIVFMQTSTNVDNNLFIDANRQKPSKCLKECGLNCDGYYGCALCQYACLLEQLGW